MGMQALQNGQKVRFDLRDNSCVDFGEEAKLAKLQDGQIGVIECLACVAEEGEKDAEYYDVKFPSGRVLHAVSGYNLTPLSADQWEVYAIRERTGKQHMVCICKEQMTADWIASRLNSDSFASEYVYKARAGWFEL